MKKRDVFWGLLFIAAAVMIILNQLGYFVGISMFDIVLTVILAGIIVTSILHFNFWGILFPLAGICIIYAEQWHITEFTPWPALLTALLCSIGLSMIFNRPRWWFCHSHIGDGIFGSSVVNEKDSNVINCSVSFGDSIKYVNSDNFERANIKCSFGDVKVYCDNAQIPSGKADIYLDVSFGDAVLYIPKTWHIINEVHVTLGDMNEKNYHASEASPVVTIHGSVSFGDANIIYV
jgi:predicted membrane protein